MLITGSFLLGLFSDWWWLPAFGGALGEMAHFASSRTYRRQLAEVPGARVAAVVATGLLTALCVGAFVVGRLVAAAF